MKTLPALLLLLLLLSSCRASTTDPGGAAVSDPSLFDQEALHEIDRLIGEAIATGRTPGAVFRIEHRGEAHQRSYGARAVEPRFEPTANETIYDIASLTKVVATAPSIMLLHQRRLLDIDDLAVTHLPELSGEGREQITLRHLLTHTAGLPAGVARPDTGDRASIISRAMTVVPINRPGYVVRYSDVNFILLGEIVHRVSGVVLDEFAAREIFTPLGMSDTMFNPPTPLHSRIAPTERSGTTILRGVVHDPTARQMGGVAGHAGLFTTAADLARFAREMLHGSIGGETRLFDRETVRLMTGVATPDGVTIRRGLGWDIDSAFSRPRGSIFPLGSFGHTGWTGSFLWIDPYSQSFYILLSNRVHPSGAGSVTRLQRDLGTAAARALPFDFESVSGALPPRPAVEESGRGAAHVRNGIDVLIEMGFSAVQGRIALLTNHTGRDRAGNPTIDLLRSAPGVELIALFAPEHGIRGERDEWISDSIDERSGVPIYSLYDRTPAPQPSELEGVGTIVFDVQDIGTRYYTYASALMKTMEAAAEAGISVVVLDRINPLNGIDIAGPSRVERVIPSAFHPMPIRHGMTIGEMARMFNAEREIGVELTVVPVAGWNRAFWFDETDLPWVYTSPNLRNMNAAALYPALGMIETAAVSVGRGTAMPLEVVGAPYVDGQELAARLNAQQVRGVRFHPTSFTPVTREFAGELCGGVRIEITDRSRLEPVRLGLVLASTLHELYGAAFQLEKVNVLLQHAPTIEAIASGRSVDEIVASWQDELEEFIARRQQFLLY